MPKVAKNCQKLLKDAKVVKRCIGLTFLHCVFSNASSNCLHEKMQSHIGCICMTDIHCVFHMLPQCTRIRAGIVPLVAFVWLFSIVHFQMFPQISCLNRSKVTLVAFDWLFSTVYFQMRPQSVCIKRCIVTSFAFVRLFALCVFKCFLKHLHSSSQHLHRRMKSHTGCICLTFFHWVFKCCFKELGSEQA